METQISLPGSSPSFSVRLFRNGESSLFFFVSIFLPEQGKNLLCWLNRIEAFTLWNFLDEALDEALEKPPKEPRKRI